MRALFDQLQLKISKLKNRTVEKLASWRSLLLAIPLVALLAYPVSAFAAGGPLSFFTGIFGSVVNASAATAGSLLVWITVIWGVTHVFMLIFSRIFLWLINFLIGVSQYNSFLGSSVVTLGWAIMRDVANMFLVVALLVIAFGAILNIESYQVQKLLPRFLGAALLVNFSKMLCGVAIDLSQVVMMTFVSGYSDTAAGNFIKLFRVDQWLKLAVTNSGTPVAGAVSNDASAMANAASDFFSSITSDIFITIIGFFGIVAILSMVCVLVARILTLWFLIVVSPLAFVSRVLPMTKGYMGSWTHAFTKQLMAGPIVAFIIWISLASVAVSDKAFDLAGQAVQGDKLFAEANSAITVNEISKWENLGLYFVPVILFIMGANYAVKTSGGMASSLTRMTAGRVKSYGRSAVGFLRNQAIGKGDFSIRTQAGRGWNGERTITSNSAEFLAGGFNKYAQKVGGGLDKLGKRGNPYTIGGQIADFTVGGLGRNLKRAGEAAEKGVDATVGASGRAANRYAYKNRKDLYAKFGYGEKAKKQREIQDADADAALVEKKANKEYDHLKEEALHKQEQAESIRAAGVLSLDEQKEAERLEREAVQARQKAADVRNVAKNKASGLRGKVVDTQADFMKYAGRTQPDSILQDFQDRIAKGEVISQVELMAGQKLMSEALDKERDKKIEEARVANGGKWDKGKENEERQKIAGQQKRYKDAMQGLIQNYRTEAVPFDTLAEGRAEKVFKDARPPNPKVYEVMAAASKEADSQRGKTMAPAAAVADYSTKIIEQLDKVGKTDTARQREALAQAMRVIPQHLQNDVLDEIRIQARTAAPGTVGENVDPATVDRLRNDMLSRTAAAVEAEISRRYSARPHTGAGGDLYNEDDLNMIKSSLGTMEFRRPEDALDMTKWLSARPAGGPNPLQAVTRMAPEILNSKEMQQVIGKSIQGIADLEAVRNAMVANGRSVKEQEQMLRLLKEAAVSHAEDNAVRDEIASSPIV